MSGLIGHRGLLLGSAPIDPLAGIPMQFRYEAWKETSYADTDPVGTVTDLSGNGNNATSTGTARPLYRTNIQNGKAVYRYDGADDFSVSGSIAAMNNTISRWYYVVLSMRSYAASITVPWAGWNIGSSSGDLEYYNNAISRMVLRAVPGAAGGPTDFAATALRGTAWYADRVVQSATTLEEIFGASFGSQSIAALATAPNGVFSMILGAYNAVTPSNFAPVDIAAVFGGSGTLSSGDRATIESYIAATWAPATPT